MTDANAYEVYASLAAVADLVGVSERRVTAWLRRGQILTLTGLTGGPHPRHRVLYNLGEVQALANAERRVYIHPRGVKHGHPSRPS